VNAEQAHHERLVEIAAAAHQHRIALNLARAVSSLYSADRPTSEETAELAAGDAAVLAADEALAEWRELHG
jgi:hypothetical protein